MHFSMRKVQNVFVTSENVLRAVARARVPFLAAFRMRESETLMRRRLVQARGAHRRREVGRGARGEIPGTLLLQN